MQAPDAGYTWRGSFGRVVMAAPYARAEENRLLAGMPREQYSRVQELFERVPLKKRSTLAAGNRPIEAAYFLEAGVASAAWSDFPHRVIDVAVLGRNAMVGSPLVLGVTASPFHVTMLTPGTALRVEAGPLMNAMAEDPRLREYLLRAPAIQLMQVAQTAACNGIHPIRNRLPRWLLMCHDQLESATIPVSQESLSDMLGVRRAGIGEALTALDHKGVTSSSHAAITVLDRRSLEAEACGCYRALLKQESLMEVAEQRKSPPVREANS